MSVDEIQHLLDCFLSVPERFRCFLAPEYLIQELQVLIPVFRQVDDSVDLRAIRF